MDESDDHVVSKQDEGCLWAIGVLFFAHFSVMGLGTIWNKVLVPSYPNMHTLSYSELAGVLCLIGGLAYLVAGAIKSAKVRE